MNSPENQTEDARSNGVSQDSETEEMSEAESEQKSPDEAESAETESAEAESAEIESAEIESAEAESVVEAETSEEPQEPSMLGVPPKQAAAFWTAIGAVKKAATWAAFPALFIGPLVIVVGTLMPWIEGRSGLGEAGGGYGLVCFSIGAFLFFSMVNAMRRGFRYNVLVYTGLALISFWSTFSFSTLSSNESYGLWFSMGGSVLTMFALGMQRLMMPQVSYEIPGVAVGRKFQAVIIAIGGVGALLSVSALDITRGSTGLEDGYRFGLVIIVAGILTAVGALFVLFTPSSDGEASGGVTFMHILWFLSGATILGVAIPYILTYVFYPVIIVTTTTPLSLASQNTAVDALHSRVFESVTGLGAIGSGLWVALASGILILWESRALLRNPS